MSRIYLLKKDSCTEELKRVLCADEAKELQCLLEKNLDLLPSDQISPGKNLRWLMVKREMAVVSPCSGQNAWWIDFLLVDQDSVPTFVECKRRNDARSRREVIGQVLEYAANGRHYWTGSELRSHAQETLGGEEALSQKLKDLTGDPDTEAEEFFSAMEKNLRQSKMRLIFFLEDSPYELRSIVEFLNGQLRDVEVLIVEARQYQHGEQRVIVPSVFGFTEEARVAKSESWKEIARSSLAKGEAAFWDKILGSTLSDTLKSGIKKFVTNLTKLPGVEVSYLLSCRVFVPELLSAKELLSIFRTGYLQISLASWRSKEEMRLTAHQVRGRDIFINKLKQILVFDEKKQYPSVAPDVWFPRSAELLALLRELSSLCGGESEHVLPAA